MQKCDFSADSDRGAPFYFEKVPYTKGMLKKVLVCLAVLLLVNTFLFAQLSEESEVVSEGTTSPVSQVVSETAQIQHVQWQAVKRATGYAVDLQQKVDGKWVDLDSFEIEESEFDFVLEAGFYRFRISALNIIGKRSNPSDWAEFELVDDSQPVLHRLSFPESEQYDCPVLARSISQENGQEIISIRGINCFSRDTTFSLVPSGGDKESKPFKTLHEQTKVPLSVVGSDPSSNTIMLMVDWSLLVPGYYDLLVEKASGGTDSFEVLVQPERMPQFNITSANYDKYLNTQCLDVVNNNGVIELEVGTNQSDTAFRLEPTANPAYPYPFATSAERVTVPAEWLSVENGRINIQVDSSQLKPGWYTLFAETPGAQTIGYDVIVENDDSLSTLPEITDVSGELNRKTLTVAITIKTKTALFSEDAADQVKVYCISEKDEFYENRRFPLHMTSAAKNGKSAVFEASASSLSEGDYALMLETADSSRIIFVHASSKYKVELAELSDEEVKERFLMTPDAALAAELAAKRAMADASGVKMPEDLPAFNNDPYAGWTWSPVGSYPADITFNSDSLRFSVINHIPNQPYSSRYNMIDNETLQLLQESEGISFESMVTGHNNNKTKWKLSVQTTEGLIDIPLNSKLKQLSQTVVIWGDYEIDPATINGLRFIVDAKSPKEAGWTNSLEVYQAKTYSSEYPVKQLSFKDPLLFTKIGAFAGFNLGTKPADIDASIFGSDTIDGIDDRLDDSGVPSFMYLSLFDCGWFAANAVYAPAGMGSRMMFGIENVLAFPNNWFEPYAGFGYLYNGDMMWQEISLGAVLFKYLNVRYMMLEKRTTFSELGFISNDSAVGGSELSWSSNWLQVGVELPLRRQKIDYLGTEVLTAKDPVLFKELHLGITGSIVDSSTRPYRFYLDDYFAGLRLVGFKHFALDAAVTIHDVPVTNMKNYGSLDYGADMKFMLPLFKNNFTPFIGLGAGYNVGNYNPDDYVYVSSEAGVKFGKYVSVSLAGTLPESKFAKFRDLASSAPILSPVTFVMSSEYTLRITVTVPLRSKK